MKLSTGLLAGVLLTVAVPLCAQTLGDLAKREQERRKVTPPAARTYTNEDLKKVAPFPGAADPTAKPGTATPGTAAPTKVEDPPKPGAAAKPDGAKTPEPAKDEAYWRKRVTAVRDEITRNESFREALQTQINSLSADFTARDDPYQRAQIADTRQKKIAELARVNTEIEAAKKTIVEIEDEARRGGVPPGWIR